MSWFLSLPHLKISFGLFSFHLTTLTGSLGVRADVVPVQMERTVVFKELMLSSSYF